MITIAKDFTYNERRCIVIRTIKIKLIITVLKEYFKNLINKNPTAFLNCFHFHYCNGYVELKDSEILDNYMEYNISSDEITYQGKLETILNSKEKTFIGFDTLHLWNQEHPKSKRAKYISETCKKIVDELNKK